jgi:hypothetical protein
MSVNYVFLDQYVYEGRYSTIDTGIGFLSRHC